MKWTEEQDVQLRKLRERGFSSTQAANEIGTTRNAAVGRAMRLGLDKRREGTRSKFAAQAKPPPDFATPQPNGSVVLLDLEPHHCRWPVRDSPSYLFCGDAKQDGSSYCSRHFSISKRGVTP